MLTCGAGGSAWTPNVVGWLAVPLLALLVLLALLRPGAASAATASVGGPPRPFDLTLNALYLRAARGETNRVAIELVGTETVVRDSGAPLAAGTGCRSLDAHSASCAPLPISPPPPPEFEFRGPLDGFVAYLGNGDDAITVTLPSSPSGILVVDGGPGDDLVDASRAHTAGPRGNEGAHLRGGPGRDTLRAGPGVNWLWGGPGYARGRSRPEASTGCGAARTPTCCAAEGATTGSRAMVQRAADPRGDDLLDGGAGTDSVGYAERVRPVVVDLARGRGGRPGALDRLKSIEGASGGFGRDVRWVTAAATACPAWIRMSALR